MSGGLDVLALKEEDTVKFLACAAHLGANQCDFQMEQYCYKRKPDGQYIINLKKLWEKLLLAARAIAAIENPADVCVISSRPYARRAILKFAAATGATAIAGRYTPGTFTNQIQRAFKEPRLLVITDPRADHQPITEASYVNIPVVAFCNVDSPTKYIDLCIPCNNKGDKSIGLMWWFLAREVLRLRGVISRELPWEVMPDLFFYRDPEEAEKEEQARQQELQTQQMAAAQANVGKVEESWGGDEMTTDWANEPAPGLGAPGMAPKPVAYPPPVTDDWASQVPQTSDWAADAPAPAAEAAAPAANQWGGSSNWN